MTSSTAILPGVTTLLQSTVPFLAALRDIFAIHPPHLRLEKEAPAAIWPLLVSQELAALVPFLGKVLQTRQAVIWGVFQNIQDAFGAIAGSDNGLEELKWAHGMVTAEFPVTPHWKGSNNSRQDG